MLIKKIIPFILLLLTVNSQASDYNLQFNAMYIHSDRRFESAFNEWSYIRCARSIQVSTEVLLYNFSTEEFESMFVIPPQTPTTCSTRGISYDIGGSPLNVYSPTPIEIGESPLLTVSDIYLSPENELKLKVVMNRDTQRAQNVIDSELNLTEGEHRQTFESDEDLQIYFSVDYTLQSH